MPRYRDALPQLNGRPVLTDGGLETVLLFHHGIDLPEFASFPLLDDADSRSLLGRYLDDFAAIARRHGVGLLLDTATWRANPDWVERLTGRRDNTAVISRRAVDLLVEYRERQPGDAPMPINGVVGPRGDGYVADAAMSPDQAADYHAPQAEAFAASEADLVSGITLNYAAEAIGLAHACRAVDVPVSLSFTVETDGRLPTGQPLGEAIEEVDAETGSSPAYYMINCAHPTHFDHALDASAPWAERVRGVRANASTMSHAELDAAEELDDGDPDDLGRRFIGLNRLLPNLSVFGGCCGTDSRHIAAIASQLFREPR